MRVLLDVLIDLAKQYAGPGVSAPDRLKGDASDRQIYRFHKGTRTWIGVINANIAENQAFFYLSNHLAQRGIPVPKIYLWDRKQVCYLLEDLGPHTLADLLQQWNPSSSLPRHWPREA